MIESFSHEYRIEPHKSVTLDFTCAEQSTLSLVIALGEQAQANIFIKIFASSSVDLRIVHEGDGASSSLIIQQVLNGSSVSSVTVFDEHKARNTTHKFQQRALVADEAQTSVSCHMVIAEHANGTHAEQKSSIMLIGSGARASMVPALEISCHDVTCAHGSSIGTFEDEDIFYAATRGLAREEIIALLSHAFFDDMLSSK